MSTNVVLGNKVGGESVRRDGSSRLARERTRRWRWRWKRQRCSKGVAAGARERGRGERVCVNVQISHSSWRSEGESRKVGV